MDSVCKLEFRNPSGPGLDLRSSVYSVTPEHITRVYCEHTACSQADLNGAMNYDLEGLWPPTDAPVEGPFTLRREAHRELIFASEAALRTMVANLVEEATGRRHKVTGPEGRAFIRERIAHGDPEWQDYRENFPKGGAWCQANRVLPAVQAAGTDST